MKIKPLFTQSEIDDLSIEKLLEKYGVKNPKKYLKGNTLESSSNYDNIEDAKQLILKYIGGGSNINQE